MTADVRTMKPCAPAVLVATILSVGMAGAQASPLGPTSSPPVTEQGPAFVAGPRAPTGAEGAAVASNPSPPGSMRWYGVETLLVDVGGVSALIAAGATRRDTSAALADLGVATYFLGGPIVHIAEGHAREAGLSFGLRVGAPLAGGVSGYLLGEATCAKDDGEVPCPAVTAALGMLSGMVSAILVDAAVLSDDPEPSSPETPHFAPTLSFTKSGATAGLVGAF